MLDNMKSWKQHPITREFRQRLSERLEEVKSEILSFTPEDLKFRQGYVTALIDIQDVFQEETND